MTDQVILATNNAKKMAELRRIVSEQNLAIEILSLGDVAPYPEPAETEWSFEGNALIKARAAVEHTGLVALADDSGLCVDALNQMPGVRSARWAGPEHDDAANLELVLRQIDDVPPAQRGARFVATVALVCPDGSEFITAGEMKGRLATEPHGSSGFGYDPIFIADAQPADADRPLTNAQLSAEQKDAISHRAVALRAMIPHLIELFGLEKRQ